MVEEKENKPGVIRGLEAAGWEMYGEVPSGEYKEFHLINKQRHMLMDVTIDHEPDEDEWNEATGVEIEDE